MVQTSSRNQKLDRFVVLVGDAITLPLLENVRIAADSNKIALGFIAKGIFEDFARRDSLYVLVEKLPVGTRYVGHLLFQRSFPRAKILQMFTLPELRREGLASMLIDFLRTSLVKDGFTSVSARVAEDLVDANAFWDRQEFYVQSVVQGGTTRNRKILVRCHELASPQLFPPSGIRASNPLGLENSPTDVVPMYLLDLNVLFDLAPRRLRHDVAVSLFQAERMNYCRLAVSDEIREELQRNALQGKTDPMESFLLVFPSFPLSRGAAVAELVEVLRGLIFPAKSNLGALSSNELSDLHHVATAIQHDLAGLITSDKAILGASSKIKEGYGIEIISPTAFSLEQSSHLESIDFETSADAVLSLLELDKSDEHAVHEFLSRMGLSGSVIGSTWLPVGAQSSVAMRYAVWSGPALVGFLALSAKDSSGTMIARIAVDEANAQAFNAARVLLMFLLERLANNGPGQVRIELAPHQSHVRDLAIGFGFRGTADRGSLVKLILGKVVTVDSWEGLRADLAMKSDLRIPEEMPAFRSASQYVQVLTPDGNQQYLPLDLLETLLAPTIFCLPGRPAVITPVQKSFSGPLLGHSRQKSLLPRGSASLFRDRHYLSDPRTLKHFRRGTLILFYESGKQGGAGEVVAIARVREAFLKPLAAIGEADLGQSVLSVASLSRIGASSMKTVTAFDNIFPFSRGVPLATLKRLGCGEPNHLITTRPISETQLQEILREAFAK